MPLCDYSVCFVVCVGSVLATADLPSEESYRLCVGFKILKKRPWPDKRTVKL
jgi:hypothetical protein